MRVSVGCYAFKCRGPKLVRAKLFFTWHTQKQNKNRQNNIFFNIIDNLPTFNCEQTTESIGTLRPVTMYDLMYVFEDKIEKRRAKKVV